VQAGQAQDAEYRDQDTGNDDRHRVGE
jgi:hypothetical protein